MVLRLPLPVMAHPSLLLPFPAGVLVSAPPAATKASLWKGVISPGFSSLSLTLSLAHESLTVPPQALSPTCGNLGTHLNPLTHGK